VDFGRFELRTLGMVGPYPILFLTPRNKREDCANVLIAGSFHGEEPAGSLGILKFLTESASNIFDSINISFLPLVNPTGFAVAQRYNTWGENPNSGYVQCGENNCKTSAEGQVLLEHLNILKDAARDCFVSLHEDTDFEDFYICTFETTENPGPFSQMLHRVESVYFSPTFCTSIDKMSAVNGIVYNHPDGSFEHRLFVEGIPCTACTETPGKKEIECRIEANRAIIDAVCTYFSK
jgi:hypothetical protein